MGNGRLELTRGASVVVPADFVGLNVEFAFPDLRYGAHWRCFDARPVRWKDIHTATSTYNWTDLDARVAAIGSAPWTYTVWGTPNWASARPAEVHPYGNGCAAEPASMTNLANFVTQLVTRYPTLTHIEAWNEPDIPTSEPTGYFWYSGTQATLVTLTSTIRTAAKAVRGSVQIIGPCSVNYLSVPNYLDGLWAAGLDAQLDGISLHAYQKQWATPYKGLLGLFHQHEYMVASRSRAGVGNTKPMYITETGQLNPRAVDVDDDTLIKGYQRLMVASAALGYKYAAWYVLDGPSFAFQGRRKVEQAVRDMVSFLPGKTLTNAYIELPEMRVWATVNGSVYSW